MAKGKPAAKKPRHAESQPKHRSSKGKSPKRPKLVARGRPGKPDSASKPAKEPAKKGKGGAASAEKAQRGRSERHRPRATKLPPVGRPVTKREMEHLLSAGEGRGVFGEGSVKGRLIVKEGLPYLQVIGRDKRELEFLLQGRDQEVLPAYVGHKVSVSGFIKKSTNYGGTIDVRRYAAKKLEGEAAPEPIAVDEKPRFLSPGEVEQLCTSGMGAGIKGFAALRGELEMTGEEFFLVVANSGTRQQVSFVLEGKAARGLRKHVGQTLQVNGVVQKTSGWGGKMSIESFEVRPPDQRSYSREKLEIVSVEGTGTEGAVEAKLNQGLTVRLSERPGYIWAIEPTVAKRVGLREASYHPGNGGPSAREFFFTPRNPGTFEIEFFLAKAFAPVQVAKTFKLALMVKP